MTRAPTGHAASARLTGVHRRFGPVVALAGADLDVRPGEIHAVLGENGAGKSTLLGVLGGMLRPDAGLLEIGGAPVELRSPRDAWAHGVGLALGRRGIAGAWRLRYARVRAQAGELMRRTGLDVPLDASTERLGVGDRQRVEILKALLRDPPLLALDEPTAVLTPGEVLSLFGLLRDLAGEGRAVILVGHKIDEVLSVADRVTVLRHGRTTLEAARREVDAAALIQAMVGRDVDDPAAVGRRSDGRGSGRTRGQSVASLDAVRLRDATGRVVLDDVDLSVSRGELVGIAGVEGNGQRELAQVLAGRLVPEAGSVRVPEGVGFIPQDRTREGLVADFDLVENVALALHGEAVFANGPFVRWDALRERAEQVRERFDVRSTGVRQRVGTLSGGNQQRLVVGRELERARDLLVAENPTRGLDVAATAFVHAELRRLREAADGPAVVLVSTDLDEVMALSDRVLVMTRGRLVTVDDAQRTREGVGALMLGGRDAVA